jgi:hypothetical protein
MARQLANFVKRLFSHDDKADMERGEAPKQKSAQEQDKLDKQRADGEGMAPTTPQ